MEDTGTLRGHRVCLVTDTHDVDHPRHVHGVIVDWLRSCGADADYCRLGDLRIEGNGHKLMLENNGEQILDVICSHIAPWG